MSDRTTSLLKTLLESSPPSDTPSEIEAQGRHAFSAVRNLIDRIEKNCSEADAEDLVKRFFNSAKTNDFRKFKRGIRKLNEKPDENTETTDVEPDKTDPDKHEAV